MPNFAPRADRVQASIPILPKGQYTFRIGEPKPFFKPDSGDGKTNYGVRYPVEVVTSEDNPSQVGKKTFVSLFLHTDGAISAAKRFMMAARGFSPNSGEDEERFNDEVSTEDQSVDTDTNMLGEYYLKAKGNLVIGNLDVQPQQNDPTREQQNFKSWLPVR